jgi:hypothetical protein
MDGHTIPGHPYVEEVNHASKGTHKSMVLGGGGRFAALADKTSPAIAAMIGRKKYGAKKMASMAAKGRSK